MKSYNVAIHVNFQVVLFIMLVDEILKCDHLMKATEQYFPVVLFIMLYKVALTFESGWNP